MKRCTSSFKTDKPGWNFALCQLPKNHEGLHECGEYTWDGSQVLTVEIKSEGIKYETSTEAFTSGFGV